MRDAVVANDIQRIFSAIDIDYKQLEGKKILITGASGLIGSYFLFLIDKINSTIEKKMEVYAIIHKEIPVWLQPLNNSHCISFIRGDLSDRVFCESLQEADYIIHAAGYAQPGVFMKNPLKTIRLNTVATDILLGKTKENGGFLFVSTSEIYSGSDATPYKEETPGSTTPQHNRACYIEGKRCGEAICMAYKNKGVDVKIGRVSLAYGPCFKHGDARVLNSFIEKAISGSIHMLDSGESSRIYCYVADTVEILWDILFKGTECVYNVGGESYTTILNLAQKIGELLNADVVVPAVGTEGVKGAPKVVAMDISKIKREFNKREYVSLDEGLRNTVEWYKHYNL